MSSAPVSINREQADCLAALMRDGELRGTRLAAVTPPASVLLGCDPLEPPWEDGSRTLFVVADDKRTWQIVTAGITWPNDRVDPR